MTINTTPLAVQLWKDPNGKPPPEETALALRMSIAERVAGVTRQKENYDTALRHLAGVPLPYDCRLPSLTDECLEIERCAWRAFIDDLHLREVLSIEARTRLDEQLYEHRRGYGGKAPLPPFTEANVFGFFEQTCASIPRMIHEAVREVFKWLTPGQRWTGCKTSNEFKIGQKVIVTYTAESNYSRGFRVNHHRRANVDALGNVLAMLDGKGVRKRNRAETDDPKLAGSYAEAWSGAWGKPEVYEDDYLTAKAFANNNVHITFKRMDIVAQINQAGNEPELQDPNRTESRGFSH